MQLDESSKKIGALHKRKSVIFSQVGDREKLMADAADLERNKLEVSGSVSLVER